MTRMSETVVVLAAMVYLYGVNPRYVLFALVMGAICEVLYARFR